MESLEKVSKARRSFPSLDPLRLCLCFLRKKDLRAAADSVFAALLSSLTSDMLSLLENSWSILQSQGTVVLGRAIGTISCMPCPWREQELGLHAPPYSSVGHMATSPTHATKDPWNHRFGGNTNTSTRGKLSAGQFLYSDECQKGNARQPSLDDTSYPPCHKKEWSTDTHCDTNGP